MEDQSLTRWKLDIQANKQAWLGFYRFFLGSRVSSYPRFWKAVNMYGFYPMFEAIVESSNRSLEGDPLNYVLRVASNKWKEAQLQQDESYGYKESIDRAKEISHKKNLELAKRVKGK